MSLPIRAAAAAILAVALATLPVALDYCSAFCETHHNAVASTPSCHHTVSSATRIGHAPIPCGHDHNATSVSTTTGLVKPERWLHSMNGALVAPAAGADVSRIAIVASRLPSATLVPHDHLLSLRI